MSGPIQSLRRKPVSADPNDYTGPSVLSIIGVLVILIGIAGMIFALRFDTTVSSYGADDVHNTGLMNDRLVYTICAGFMLLFGVGLVSLGRRGPVP